jgi:hypothetical protein
LSAVDAEAELSELEKKLSDAERRFDRMPGALWLASTAIIESATRLGEALPAALDERRTELLVRARRARDEAGPRSSENDVSAITMWVELAEKRAALEQKVLAALERVQAHRAEHPSLGETPRSRKALEKALGEREKDVVERDARLAVAIDELEQDELALLREKGVMPPAVDERTSDAELLARSKQARARLAATPSAWHSSLIFGVVILGMFTLPFVANDLLRNVLVGGMMAALMAALLARGRASARRRDDLFEAHAMRRRDEVRRDAAKEDHARLIAAARALGALDAFGATDDGRTLEDRESKLVTLAPWIREMVNGFSATEAAAFA